MVWPESITIKMVDTYSLVMGLVVIGISFAMDLVEGFHGRHEIEEEAGDLDEPVRKNTV